MTVEESECRRSIQDGVVDLQGIVVSQPHVLFNGGACAIMFTCTV